MRIFKGFSREAIQLVNTRRPLIKFNMEEGVKDKKVGESRVYKVKQVPKGQNVTYVDASYTLVWDLLRGNTLTAFNNKQATFDKQSLEYLEHCLNAVTVHVFPNKAYKLQK
eukprot:8748316-Ditylum_brightwellii.AAC.1